MRAREVDLMLVGTEVAIELADEFGPGSCFHEAGPTWPSWPRYAMADYDGEPARPAKTVPELPVPVAIDDVPSTLERVTNDRGDNFVIRWRRPTRFTNGEVKP